MGEAGKEHQALLLHCAVEVAGDADMFATDAQPATLTLSAADLDVICLHGNCRHGVTERGWTLSFTL